MSSFDPTTSVEPQPKDVDLSMNGTNDAAASSGGTDIEYRPLFLFNPVPMWVFDVRTLRFLAVNDAAVRDYGYTREEFLGMTILDIRPADTIPALQANLAQASRPSEKSGEWIHRKKDGTLIHVEITLHELPFGGPSGRLVLAQDITARRQAEADFRELKSHLETRVTERTEQLQATLKELETFSFSVSHDLRAPLRAIDGFARALLEDHGAQLDGEGRRLVNVIRQETRRTTQLIEDLLAFSRVGRQELDAADVDMTELARSAFQLLTEATPGVYARLELGALPASHGDRAMLRQVFANLLGNAIKFSSRHPAPVLVVTGECDGSRNVYRIQDNGVGFDPRYSDKLFAVFQRLHSQSEFEGTGVGLAIVQRIVHRHGGTVWAEGQPNTGASFYFALPLRLEGEVNAE